MDIFNLHLPEDNDDEKNKRKDLASWFDFMNDQLEKIEESHQKSQINNLLIDNDIDIIE